MKLFHLADLHLGKIVNGVSMLEDQRYILQQILNLADEEKPRGVLIAGDVYDRSVPTTDAVDLLDDFITRLSCGLHIPVFLVAGNHDSAERLNFGSRIFKESGVHIAGAPGAQLERVTLHDEFGPLHIYLLPFVRAAVCRQILNVPVTSCEEAVRGLLNTAEIPQNERNVLVAHQFVTGAGQAAIRSESETISVGGTDQVDADVFSAFDYVALGHLHAPQSVGRPTVRYAGSPLKYSFSEALHKKSVTVVELGEKGDVSVRHLPLVILRDMRVIRGKLGDLLSPEISELANQEDYIRAVLTDEEDLLDPIGKLRQVYPHVMRLDFDNKKHKESEPDNCFTLEAIQHRLTKMELFERFYEAQNNVPMTAKQKQLMEAIIKKVSAEGQE